MPLTPLQSEVLALLADQRNPESHLAGATGLLMAKSSPRRSHDLDFFHDAEEDVARAFASDRAVLEHRGFLVWVSLSQPGFIRADIGRPDAATVRVDWAHDSRWRFMPPVRLEHAGYVLHPVDLAVNKVLALAGRDEVRDFVDILYLVDRVLPLGALAWAAAGKDPGLNPAMLLDLLARKGRIQQRELDRLDLARPIDAGEAAQHFRHAVESGREWVSTRPPDEAGCLYRRPGSALFFAPGPGEACVPHRGAPGGVIPVLGEGRYLSGDPDARAELENFFERRVL
jgi:hypothetical protein